MPDRPKIIRRTVTPLQDSTGRWIARANVWTAKGYSTRTFNTVAEAEEWVPHA
jgi:hypothetical protein